MPSEDARKAVLDRLFGAEEEFEYSSTTSSASSSGVSEGPAGPFPCRPRPVDLICAPSWRIRRNPRSRPALRVRARERERSAGTRVDLCGWVPPLQGARRARARWRHDRAAQLLPGAGERDYVVDPGVIMQGAPVTGRSLRARHRAAHGQGDPDAHALRPRRGADRVRRSARPTCTRWSWRRPTRDRSRACSTWCDREADGRGGRDRAGRALDPDPGPLQRADLAPGRHRRRPGRDRLRLRRPAARVLREDGPARGLRPRARRAAAPVASGSASSTPTW